MGRLLLVRGDLLKDNGVVLVDVVTREIEATYSMPSPLNADLHVRGAAGDYVLAWSRVPQGGQRTLYVLEPQGGDLEIVNEATLAGLECAVCDAMDPVNGRWFVCENAGDQEDPAATRVRAFAVPSLETLTDVTFSGRTHWRGMHLNQKASLLLLNLDRNNEELAVLNAENGQALTVLDLDACWHDDLAGSWIPFSDPAGHYIGAFGSHWIQLFAVAPDTAR